MEAYSLLEPKYTTGSRTLYVSVGATVESNTPPLFSSGCPAAVEREVGRKEMNKSFLLSGTVEYLFFPGF